MMNRLAANFSDYDHENERHVSLDVDGLTLRVYRQLDFNPDYAEDVEPPDDWSDSSAHIFADVEALAAFLAALGEALIGACFSYFPGGSQLDSDEARDAWATLVGQLAEVPSGAAVDVAAIDAIVEFPR